jgi:signal transduction histidine kinase
MWQNNLPLRVAGPTVLLSLLLLGLCAAAAVYLYSQQAVSGEELRENVSSAQAAHDLENTLRDVAALLRHQRTEVEPLNRRIASQLAAVRRLADKEEEKKLVDHLEASLKQYLAYWQNDTPPDAEAIKQALDIAESARPVCGKLEEFNARQTRDSARSHSTTVQRVVAGLLAIGTLGSLAGLLLGYNVARGVRHSIYQLSVRVRDAAGKLGQELPAVVVTEDGDLHHVHAQVQSVMKEIEQVVSKLQQREREVLRAEQLAAVGQLAAGMAHELRNPLTSIKILVQSLREDVAARGLAGEDLQIIEVEIRRMERCLQTFLDFARPPRPECRPLDLRQIVERTVTLVGSRARKQHVTLHYHSPGSPVIVTVDGDHIHQLLVNLTLNALDFMPRGGVLEIELRQPSHGWVELRVLDSGPGITAEAMEYLFQPFVSSKETGLGLGLVISRRIAESHGGTLEASNRPQGGACFVLRLPVAESASAETEKNGTAGSRHAELARD